MDIMKYIMELINNGLFPIACCGGLIYVILKLFTSYRDDLKKLNEQYDSQTKEFVSALNKNTIALNKLCEKLDTKGGDKNEK